MGVLPLGKIYKIIPCHIPLATHRKKKNKSADLFEHRSLMKTRGQGAREDPRQSRRPKEILKKKGVREAYGNDKEDKRYNGT